MDDKIKELEARIDILAKLAEQTLQGDARTLDLIQQTGEQIDKLMDTIRMLQDNQARLLDMLRKVAGFEDMVN